MSLYLLEISEERALSPGHTMYRVPCINLCARSDESQSVSSRGTEMLPGHSVLHLLLLSLLPGPLSCTAERSMPGSSLTLSCPAPVRWFFCVWVSPAHRRVCQLRDQRAGPGLCGGEDRLRITGNHTTCQLTIAGVELRDHGDWTCAVSDSESLETVKRTVLVEVVVVGEVRLTQQGEGLLTRLQCGVGPAWPRPRIVWSSDSLGLQEPHTEEVAEEPGSHLVSVSQTVTEHRGNVTCRVTQGDVVRQRSLVVQGRPLTARISSRMGLVSLGLCAVVLFIILLAGLALFGIRRKEIKIETSVGSPPASSRALNISYIDLHQQAPAGRPGPAVSPPPAYSEGGQHNIFHCQHSCFTHRQS